MTHFFSIERFIPAPKPGIFWRASILAVGGFLMSRIWATKNGAQTVGWVKKGDEILLQFFRDYYKTLYVRIPTGMSMEVSN